MFRKGDQVPAKKVPTDEISDKIHPLNSKIYVIYNDAEEFSAERKWLWNEVLPELQQFGFQSGIDIEWIDPLAEKGWLTINVAEKIVEDLKKSETDFVICLLGDKYGTAGPPSEIRKEEYESIRSAVFEQNADVKMLDDHYLLDRSRKFEEYRLKPNHIDSKTKAKLTKIIQSGAAAAFEEGTINQVNQDRQLRFKFSPVHFIVNQANAMADKCTFLLRKFEGAKAELPANSKYLEKKSEQTKAIENLKNHVSEKYDKKAVFPYVFKLDGGDIESFYAAKDLERYKSMFLRQVTERLKALISGIHPQDITTSKSTYYDIAALDHESHMDIYNKYASRPWQTRIFDAVFKEKLPKAGGNLFLLQGPDICGKTRTLCNLYERASASQDIYKIIRFVGQTYSSQFAHEFWRNLCYSICQITSKFNQKLTTAYKLAQIVEVFDELMDTLDKPLYLFIDDLHVLKHGHFLSLIEKRIKNAPSKLAMFVTSSNISSIQPLFTVNQTINIEPLTESEFIEALKLNVSRTERKVSSENWSKISQQMAQNGHNIIVAEALLGELLHRGDGDMSGGIEGRLIRIESELGIVPVRALLQYLCVTSNGLTRLELHDVLSKNASVMEKIGALIEFPQLLLDRILESLDPFLICLYLDQRVVYRIRHNSLLTLFRTRYLTGVAELKSAHGDLSELFSDNYPDYEIISARGDISYQVFPQGLRKEGKDEANIRKIRNLWFHLLHTGNMDALKESSLCNYEYVDLTVKSCGVPHLLSLYEECAKQVLHHDIQVLCEQVLVPALPTIFRDPNQMSAEVIGRLRYTRTENSHFLNTMVEQAMAWVDLYQHSLLVPLTCWIPPPLMKTSRTFYMKDWKPHQTILAPSKNHQHVLVTGNATAPGLIYMYHIPSTLLITSFKGHTANVTAICTSNNGLFFVSSSVDKTVKLWSFSTGECTKTFRHHNNKVMCCILSSDDELMITGSADSTAKVIRLETGEVLRSFHEHTGSVVSLQLTYNNGFLITGSGDFIVQMWDLSNGKCISKMGGLMAPVNCLAITTNDAFVAVACEDETLRVFSTVAGQELLELMGHEGKVNGLVCAQDDCQLFAATKSKIFCYDIHNGQILDILDCKEPFPVYSLKISADNYFLFSACGSRIHVWNVQKRIHDDRLDTAQDNEGFITSIILSSDEKIGACGTFSGVIALWDMDVCQCISTTAVSKGVPISCLSFSVNNVFLLSGNLHGLISVLDASSGNVIKHVNLHSSEILSIYLLDNYRVFSCDKDARLVQWEAFGDEDSVEEVCSNILPPIFVPSSGKVLLSHVPKANKEMKVWGLVEDGTPKELNTMSHTDEITCFAAIQTGRFLATGSADQSIKLWIMETGFFTQVLIGHEAAITCCAFSENEVKIVSAAKDCKVIIWNVETGDIAYTLNTMNIAVSITLTSDASVAFSATKEGWVECWSTERGTMLSSFNTHRQIRHIIQSLTANRILVHLTSCAQLPILCLHNSPAESDQGRRRKKSARAQSVTSISSELNAVGDQKKEMGSQHTLQPIANNVNVPVKTTFDKLERSKSRTSLIEKDRSTTVTSIIPIQSQQKSKLCVIL